MGDPDRIARERQLRGAILRGDELAWRMWYDESFADLLGYVAWRYGGRRDPVNESRKNLAHGGARHSLVRSRARKLCRLAAGRGREPDPQSCSANGAARQWASRSPGIEFPGGG